MHEFQGWIVMPSAEQRELESLLQDIVREGLVEGFVTPRLNANHCVMHISGLRNHLFPGLFTFCQRIAEDYPDAYGAVHSTDHESDEFTVITIVRGRLRQRDDPWFSPRITTIEDPAGDESQA